MNELNFNQACSIVFNVKWHKFLSSLNIIIYKIMLGELKEANGCSDIQRILKKTLHKLTTKEYKELILHFYNNHPHMIKGYICGFNSKIASFPRRTILLKHELTNFDAITYKYVIYHNLIYIEYLRQKDPLITKWPIINISERLGLELHEK